MNTTLLRIAQIALLALPLTVAPSCSDAPAKDYAGTYDESAAPRDVQPAAAARPATATTQQPTPASIPTPMPAGKPAPAPAPAPTVALTQTYKHPSGAVFRHPADWTVQNAGDGALALDPTDLHKVGGERAEIFLVTGEDAQGVTSVSDPRVAQTVGQMVRQTFPHLQKDGEPTTTRGALVLRFKGQRNQIDFRAEMRVKLAGGFALATFALTDASRIASRSKVIAAVFDSIGYEKPKSDPRLVGHWRYSKTYISGSFSSITVRNLVLNADGTCLEGGKLMAGMSHYDNSGNFTGSSSGRHQPGVDYRGRWRLNGKMLTMTWDNGSSETWSIYIEGNSMLWKSGKSRKLWKKLR